MARSFNKLARVGASVAIAGVGFLGLTQVSGAQAVDPYPTTTTAPPTTGPDVSASTLVQDPTTTVAASAEVEADELANTGSDSGRIALLGLAALGTGGVCISAARRRSSAN